MINQLTDSGGQPIYKVQEFIIDSEKDITKLPTNVAPGSSAFCIATCDMYLLDGGMNWCKIT